MPQLEKQDVLWVIDKLINDQWQYRNQRSSIKKWSITVWLATIVALFSGSIEIGLLGAAALIFVPLFSFWILEGIYGAIDQLHAEHISDLENRLTCERYDYDVPSEVFFISRNQKFSLSKKIRLFRYAFFKAETVAAIYYLLVIASTVFLILKYWR